MWKYYVILEDKGRLRAVFFHTQEAAEEYQEENYYRCTGDIMEVPADEAG